MKRVLLIPHTPISLRGWQGSRHQRLLPLLSREVEIHLVDFRWKSHAAPADFFDNCELHSVWLPPRLARLCRGYPSQTWLMPTQTVWNAALRRIVRRVNPDVALVASSHHFTGFPSALETGPSMVFDYVDLSPQWVEEWYCARASAVAAVSPGLAARAKRWRPQTTIVPNGVTLSAYGRMDKTAARRSLGLTDMPTVGLIGLTYDPSAYFVDALNLAWAQGSRFQFLLVGEAPARLLATLRRSQFPTVAPGPIPAADVARWFDAVDVGLYPGGDNDYFRTSAPLKIVEYLAGGASVVASSVEVFSSLANVLTVPADAQSFGEAIRRALRRTPDAVDLRDLDWAIVADRMLETLRIAASDQGVRPREPEQESVPCRS